MLGTRCFHFILTSGHPREGGDPSFDEEDRELNSFERVGTKGMQFKFLSASKVVRFEMGVFANANGSH